MKLKHTQARKANTHAFRKTGHHGPASRRRMIKRSELQPKVYCFGKQVIRTQRCLLKKERFDAPIYKTIKHAAV